MECHTAPPPPPPPLPMFEADSQNFASAPSDSSLKIFGPPSVGTIGGPKEEGCPSQPPPPPSSDSPPPPPLPIHPCIPSRSASSWRRGGGAAGCRSCSTRPDPGVRTPGGPTAEAAVALPPPPLAPQARRAVVHRGRGLQPPPPPRAAVSQHTLSPSMVTGRG